MKQKPKNPPREGRVDRARNAREGGEKDSPRADAPAEHANQSVVRGRQQGGSAAAAGRGRLHGHRVRRLSNWRLHSLRRRWNSRPRRLEFALRYVLPTIPRDTHARSAIAPQRRTSAAQLRLYAYVLKSSISLTCAFSASWNGMDSSRFRAIYRGGSQAAIMATVDDSRTGILSCEGRGIMGLLDRLPSNRVVVDV